MVCYIDIIVAISISLYCVFLTRKPFSFSALRSLSKALRVLLNPLNNRYSLTSSSTYCTCDIVQSFTLKPSNIPRIVTNRCHSDAILHPTEMATLSGSFDNIAIVRRGRVGRRGRRVQWRSTYVPEYVRT